MFERFLRYVLQLVPEFIQILQILALVLIIIDGLAIGAVQKALFILGPAVRAVDHFDRFYSFLRIHNCKPSSKYPAFHHAAAAHAVNTARNIRRLLSEKRLRPVLRTVYICENISYN